MTAFDPPTRKGNGFSGFPAWAVDAAVEAADHLPGSSQRREHLLRAQIFATLALREEVRLLTGTLAALGRFAHDALREWHRGSTQLAPGSGRADAPPPAQRHGEGRR